MVKCINPLFSTTARGRVGGLVYQASNNGFMCRTHVLQRHKPSESQLALNYAFGVAADSWRLLTDEEKDEYNRRASGKRMSGYNLYIKENIIIP